MTEMYFPPAEDGGIGEESIWAPRSLPHAIWFFVKSKQNF